MSRVQSPAPNRVFMFDFYTPVWTYYGNTCGGRAASTGSKSFHQVFINLDEYVGVHNVSTKFYNQPSPPMHSGIMALELSRIRVPLSKSKSFYYTPEVKLIWYGVRPSVRSSVRPLATSCPLNILNNLLETVMILGRKIGHGQ